MTLSEMLDSVPEPFRPIVERYGPALIKMTGQEFCAWLELLALGRTFEAWQSLVEKLDDPGLVESWRQLTDKWDQANARNAERLALQRQAAIALLRVLLAAALATVGL